MGATGFVLLGHDNDSQDGHCFCLLSQHGVEEPSFEGRICGALVPGPAGLSLCWPGHPSAPPLLSPAGRGCDRRPRSPKSQPWSWHSQRLPARGVGGSRACWSLLSDGCRITSLLGWENILAWLLFLFSFVLCHFPFGRCAPRFFVQCLPFCTFNVYFQCSPPSAPLWSDSSVLIMRCFYFFVVSCCVVLSVLSDIDIIEEINFHVFRCLPISF